MKAVVQSAWPPLGQPLLAYRVTAIVWVHKWRGTVQFTDRRGIAR